MVDFWFNNAWGYNNSGFKIVIPPHLNSPWQQFVTVHSDPACPINNVNAIYCTVVISNVD